MDANIRAERRRFILTQHPDRGGDARTFAVGLRRFDDQQPGPAPAGTAAAHRWPTVSAPTEPVADWPVGLLTHILRRLRDHAR